MRVKNRLKEILQEMGIRDLVPTQKLLTEKLDGMTLIRFNKLLGNTGATEITVREIQVLTQWLSDITGQPYAAIELLETAKMKEVAA